VGWGGLGGGGVGVGGGGEGGGGGVLGGGGWWVWVVGVGGGVGVVVGWGVGLGGFAGIFAMPMIGPLARTAFPLRVRPKFRFSALKDPARQCSGLSRYCPNQARLAPGPGVVLPIDISWSDIRGFLMIQIGKCASTREQVPIPASDPQ